MEKKVNYLSCLIDISIKSIKSNNFFILENISLSDTHDF